MSGDAPARRGAREMSGSAERMRAWRGPAILSFGFRPFFLGAGAFAAIAMVLWIGMLSGRVAVPTAFDPVSWHAHELLWGYFSAVAAGFLLTAVPNWTGRLPLVGWPLAVLAGLWLAGRLAVAFSAHLPALAAAAVDLSFLAALTLAIGREIVAGRNWRNLKVLALLTVLTGANAAFHAEALAGDYAAGGYGFRIGLGVAVMLISVIGGRVVPSFTRNWLARRAPGRLPAPFGRVDQAALALTLIAGLGSARRLFLRRARLRADRRRRAAPRSADHGDGAACLDGGRHRGDEPGDDDPGQPRPFGPGADGEPCGHRRLSRRHRRGCGAAGLWSSARARLAAAPLSPRLDRGLRGFHSHFPAAARAAPARPN
jgi:hypothetical protein